MLCWLRELWPGRECCLGTCWSKLSNMATLTKSEIAALSIDERLTLLDNLWESFENVQESLSPPDWHKEVLDRRLDEAERSPEASIPWEVARTELTKKWLR